MTAPVPLAAAVPIVRPRGARHLAWTLNETCPTEWWARLERCGGGFFHSPAAFSPGDDALLLAELRCDDEVAGIAAGVWRRCRLSRRARHVYFPTAPAMIGNANNEAALTALIERLRAAGAAEVIMDSFDARWVPGPTPGAVPATARNEYVLSLEGQPSTWLRDMAHHHRRHLRRAEHEAWRFGQVEPAQAPAVIAAVQREAAGRAARRHSAFAVTPVDTPTGLHGAPWGTAAFGVWRADTLLGAALVGWGGRRAFYLQGGSTPAGYECDAAVWLHWSIMNHLSERGFAVYNLGGNPAAAVMRDHPGHGLHRFKSGFGPALVACRGLSWTLDHAHQRAHAVWRFMRRPWSWS